MSKNCFDYPRRLDQTQADKIWAIRQKFKQLFGELAGVPSSRYCSLAKQSLEEAELWLTKAVAFHGVDKED